MTAATPEAIRVIDLHIAELEDKLEALKTARAVLAGETGAPLSKPAAQLAAGEVCDEADENCAGDLQSKTCSDCDFTVRLCEVHGDARTLGGRVGAHRRFRCEG